MDWLYKLDWLLRLIKEINMADEELHSEFAVPVRPAFNVYWNVKLVLETYFNEYLICILTSYILIIQIETSIHYL